MDPHEAGTRLRKIGLFANLPDDEIDRIARCVTWRTTRAHSKIIDLSGEARVVYFVSEGSFSVDISTPAGEVVQFRSVRAGGHFGELAVMAGERRSTTVIAETPGVLAECGGAQFMNLLHANPCLARNLAVSLARSVMLLSDRVFELSALEARFRLYVELLRLLQDGEARADGVYITNAPTHEKLANYIGVQREVVTRELRALAEDGIVSIGRRKLIVHQPKRLRTIVERRAGVAAVQAIAREGRDSQPLHHAEVS